MIENNRLGLGISAGGNSGKTVLVKNPSDVDFATLRDVFQYGNDPVNGDVLIFPTIQEAVSACRAYTSDVIKLAPGVYDESVDIPRTKGGLKFVGLGGIGQVAIAPTAAAVNGLTFHCDDLTLENIDIDVSGSAASLFALAGTGSRLRLKDCKLEGASTGGSACLGIGPGMAADITAGTEGKSGDFIIEKTQFCWADQGIQLIASDFGVPTEVFVHNNKFHNLVTSHLTGVDGGFGIGSVATLDFGNNVCNTSEGGAEPTKYITNLDSATNDDGIISGNVFAHATNAAAVFETGSNNMFWVGNFTEAGLSTGAPA